MLKIGHRGAKAYAAENTLASFRRAIVMGADGIELDIHRCKSGELVIIHDDTVDRTTNGTGKVAELTLGELKALVVEGCETIPTLAEVFDALGPESYYFLEVKHAAAARQTAEAMCERIARGWPGERLHLISFHHPAFAAARKAFAEANIGASFERWRGRSIRKAVKLGAGVIAPYYRYVTRRYVERAHAAGLLVIVWTVNEAADIARMYETGVDGIIGDYPDRLLPAA